MQLRWQRPPSAGRSAFCAIAIRCAAVVLVCSIVSFFSYSQTQSTPATQRKVLLRTAPAYPPLAHNMALEGIVRLDAVVSPDGSVKAVSVKGGHPVLAQAAMNAVRQWRWERAPRESVEAVEVKFSREQ